MLGNSAAEGLSHRQRKIIGGWLLGCCGMVAGAVILGECMNTLQITLSTLKLVSPYHYKGV